MTQRSASIHIFLRALAGILVLSACSSNPYPDQTGPHHQGLHHEGPRAGALWAAPESASQIRNSASLQMFYSPRCPHCRRAKAWLESRGMAFTLRDISLEQHRAEFRALGGQGVPTFYRNGRSLQGFDAASLEAFLAESN